MERIEIFNSFSVMIILFIAGLGLLASPYEIEDEKIEGAGIKSKKITI